MTTRRLFLKGLCLSAAGATLPLLSERELHRQIYDDPVVQEVGFGLAPVKREGSAMLYEAPARRYLTGPGEHYIMTHYPPSYRFTLMGPTLKA